MKRNRLSKGGSKRLYKSTASKTHKLNLINRNVSRGGIRL